ncbi:MAG: hypothetical protein ACLFNB_04950 [Candidatus Woesearchaeota archaeon]
MVLFNLRIGRLKIPLYDIGTLAAGFYIGYSEGKGFGTSQNVEYIAKYGPAALTATMTPAIIGLKKGFEKLTVSKLEKGLSEGDLRVKSYDGSVRNYKDISEEEKRTITPSIRNSIDVIEQERKNSKYIPQMVKNTSITAVETLVGYVAGHFYSKIE